jgi:putative tryptophan/tyrosine transport system substrate-binding protein
MRRRAFIRLLGGGIAAAWPLGARAQQPGGMRRIAVLMPYTHDDPEDRARVAALQGGLRQLGWIEGQNIRSEYRWYAGDADRARVLAKELVELQPDLIVAGATPGALALRQETRTIPIVFVPVTDPVGQGLVEGLARPGGNATGLSLFEFSVGSKWLEALNQIAPRVTRVAVVYNPETAVFAPYLESIGAAATALRLQLIPAPVRGAADIEAALTGLGRSPGGGLLCLPDTYLNVHRELFVTLAARHKLPAVYAFRFFAVDGGLMSYGVDFVDLYRRAASYIDRILKGAKPADMPVQSPDKYELVLNLKTAKALDLTVPQTLLYRADEVIE